MALIFIRAALAQMLSLYSVAVYRSYFDVCLWTVCMMLRGWHHDFWDIVQLNAGIPQLFCFFLLSVSPQNSCDHLVCNMRVSQILNYVIYAHIYIVHTVRRCVSPRRGHIADRVDLRVSAEIHELDLWKKRTRMLQAITSGTLMSLFVLGVECVFVCLTDRYRSEL